MSGTWQSDSTTIRVGMISAQPVVRAGLKQLLSEAHLTITVEASTVDEAVSLMSPQSCDVAIVDTDSDDVTLHAITQLTEAGVARVLVLTAVTDPKVHRHAFALGALGVVQKDQPPETLIRAIRALHAGEAWLERVQAAHLLNAIRRRRDPEQIKIESLTKREREVITLVGQGLSGATIGERLFISEATVRNHLTSILGKLDLSNRYELAVFAFTRGLVGFRVSPPTRPVAAPRDARTDVRRAVSS